MSRSNSILSGCWPNTDDSFIFIYNHCVVDEIFFWCIEVSTLQECAGIFVAESQSLKLVTTIIDPVAYVDASDNSSSWFDQVLLNWWPTTWIGFQTVLEKEIKPIVAVLFYDSSDLEFTNLLGG